MYNTIRKRTCTAFSIKNQKVGKVDIMTVGQRIKTFRKEKDFSQAEVNYARCRSEKQFIKVEGAEHTMAFTDGGDDIKKTILEFIERYTN